MSGPTLGIGRISIPYTVNSLTHVLRMYVSNPTLSGADWVVDLHPSIGGTSVWTTAAQGLADAFSYIQDGGAAPGTALLEEYASTGWLPRDTASVTLTNKTGTAVLTSQCTLTLRATDYTRPKIVVMEGTLAAPQKITSPTGGSAAADSFIDPFLGSSSVVGRPWAFMTTMHGAFLLSASFVSATVTLNRKLRRARGLA